MKISYTNRRPHFCVGRALLDAMLTRSFYVAALNFGRTGLEPRNIRKGV